jgi:hypothetical protein
LQEYSIEDNVITKKENNQQGERRGFRGSGKRRWGCGLVFHL